LRQAPRAAANNQWNLAAEEFTLEGMDVRLFHSANDFGSIAHWVYRTDPVLFTSELTTLRATRGVTDGVFLSVTDCDGEIGAAMQTPGDALLVSGLQPAMAKAAAVELSTVWATLPGVRGTRPSATAFADAWCSVTGAQAGDSIGRTLYRLGDLVAPKGVPGECCIAGPADADLLLEWIDGFFVDAFGVVSDKGARRGFLGDIRAYGGDVVLWAVGGEPVSMARVHAPAAGMSRIGPVYTPAANRGRGFAAAVTAAAAAHAHRRGARHVVLFADVVNVVANGIYKRLGFVPVADSLECAFVTQLPKEPANV
jgi:GNAT superfamily N-acetyltransferase